MDKLLNVVIMLLEERRVNLLFTATGRSCIFVSLLPLYLASILREGCQNGRAFAIDREYKFFGPKTHPGLILFNSDDACWAGGHQGFVARHDAERPLKGLHLELRDFTTEDLASKSKETKGKCFVFHTITS